MPLLFTFDDLFTTAVYFLSNCAVVILAAIVACSFVYTLYTIIDVTIATVWYLCEHYKEIYQSIRFAFSRADRRKSNFRDLDAFELEVIDEEDDYKLTRYCA